MKKEPLVEAYSQELGWESRDLCMPHLRSGHPCFRMLGEDGAGRALSLGADHCPELRRSAKEVVSNLPESLKVHLLEPSSTLEKKYLWLVSFAFE